jgi:hypothetical protein
MRSNFLKIGQWKFRFGLTPAKFAQENNIPAEQATKVFDDTKAQAEQRLSMTLGRARKAELQAVERLESRTGSPRVVWQLRFKTFLLPVEPIEWYRIYKRVELCPTEQESDE